MSDGSQQPGPGYGNGRTIASVAWVLLFGIAFGTGAGRAQQAAPGATEVIQQLRQGGSPQALATADKALAAQPKNCALLSLRAVALTGLSRTSAALSSFEHALSLCPSYLPALEGAAQIKYAEQSDKAVPLLNQILAIEPTNALAHAMLASTYRRENRCAEALPHFAASSSLFATKLQLLSSYGYCLAQSGHRKAALEQYAKLLAEQPSDETRFNVALLQWKTGAPKAALSTLSPFVSAGTNSAALSLASRICEDLGDTSKAVTLLRQAIIAAPDDLDNYIDFANLAFVHSSFQVGIDILNAGLRRLPGAARLYLARGVLEVQLTQYEQATADFEKAHTLDPELSFASDAIGMMHSQKHHATQSLAYYREQVAHHPNDPLLHYLLAEQLADKATSGNQETMEAAVAAAKTAVSLDPSYLPAHDLLAMLYVRSGDYQSAIGQAEEALKLSPDDQQALYQQVMAERRLGNSGRVKDLASKLKAVRETDAKQQQEKSRYRLQDSVEH